MPALKSDIIDTSDIREIVRSFYRKAMVDGVIGIFFTQVVTLDIETHLPKIINFWSSLLLDTNTYKDNPMIKHIELSRKKLLTQRHFDRWIELWNETIDNLYEGPIADEAKERALQISRLMQHKIAFDQSFK